MRTALQERDRRATSTRLGARRLLAALALTAPLAFPLTAHAQGSVAAGSRWDAWVGCWQAEAAPAAVTGTTSLGDIAGAPAAGAPTVCIVPTGAPGTVAVATVAGGKLVSQDRIVATGQRQPRSREGCTGWESAQWSASGERLYLHSMDSCPRGIARTSSGILAMSPGGEWLDVQGVTVRGQTGVRVIRYRSAAIPAALPAQLASALRGRGATAVSTARMVAAASLTTRDVIEASHQVDPAVTQAWLLARGQRFKLDARQLVALANAGVPGSVTDAMVALSYPKEFAVNEPGVGGGGVALTRQSMSQIPASAYGSTGYQVPVFMDPYSYSPYGYDSYGYSPYYGLGLGYMPYGYAPLGYSPYGYGAAYGYAPYGGWYTPPVIVLRGTQHPTTPGRVINGRGYTPNFPSAGEGRVAQPRGYEAPPPSSSEAPPPPARTAHRRP